MRCKFWNIENLNSVDTYVRHQFEKDIIHTKEGYVINYYSNQSMMLYQTVAEFVEIFKKL